MKYSLLSFRALCTLTAMWVWAAVAMADPTDSECGWTIRLTTYQKFQRQVNSAKNNSSEGITADHFLEVWAPDKFTGTLTYEEVNLPDGRYTVSADIFTSANSRINFMAGDKVVTLRPTDALLHHVSASSVDVKGGRLVYGINVVDAASWVGIANIKVENSGLSMADTLTIGAGGQAVYYSQVSARVPNGITAFPITGVGSNDPVLGEEVSSMDAGTPYLLQGEAGRTLYISGRYTRAGSEPQQLAADLCGTHSGAWVAAGSNILKADGTVEKATSPMWLPAGSVWSMAEAEAFDYAATTEWSGIDWQAGLNDNRLVCQLSIPGTHDSATGSGFANSDSNWLLGASLVKGFAQTQETTIPQQLEQGIRAFDLRPATNSKADGGLQIHHGIAKTQVSMKQALGYLTAFLDSHPTEFFVVHMRHEDDGDYGDGNWAALIREQLEGISKYLVEFRPTLTVGEMRGKMLIISRDNYGDKPLGGYFQNWPGDQADINVQSRGRIWSGCVRSVCYVQDYSNAYGDENGKSKKDIKRESLVTLLNHSMHHTTSGTADIQWTFNFASAYSLMTKILSYNVSSSDGYRDNAASTNTAICEYLQTNSGPTGIMLMDYVGVDKTGSYQTNGRKAVNAIISNNFRY